MNAPISSSYSEDQIKTLSAQGKAFFQENQIDCKPLVGSFLKHFIATKINNFTGQKFQCLRNWQESSGRSLLQKAEKTFEPVAKKYIEKYGNIANQKLEGIKTELNSGWKGMLSYVTGVNQSVEICQKFVNLTRDILLQGEADQTKTMDRLLVLTGIVCSSNEDIKQVVNTAMASCTKDVFENLLPSIMKHFCGVLAGPIEKFVAFLGIKGVVDNFLQKYILQSDQSETVSERIKRSGDVYEKLILKGVSAFVENKEGKELKLEDLLSDVQLDQNIRDQLTTLKNLYDTSRLTKFTLGVENSLVPKVLSGLNGKDVYTMPKDELKEVLMNAGIGSVKEGVINAAESVKKGAISVGQKAAEGAVSFVKGVVNVATSAVREIACGAQRAVSWVFGSKPATSVLEALDKNQAEQGRESDESALEEDFGEYLQNLFDETPQATQTVTTQKSVEQSSETGTGIGAVVLDKATDALVGGIKIVGKGLEAAAPAIEATGNAIYNAFSALGSAWNWMRSLSQKPEDKNPSPESQKPEEGNASPKVEDSNK